MRSKKFLVTAFLALPLACAVVLCILIRPEIQSILVPAWGPWAGWLYGHSDCTMASQWPVPVTAALTVGGIACLVVLCRKPARAARLSAAGVWALAWEFAAITSVLNTTS